MKKTLIQLVCILFISTEVFCQQNSIKSKPYFKNNDEIFSKFLMNSSYTAEDKNTEIGLNAYEQMVGYPGSFEQSDFFATTYSERLKCGFGLLYSNSTYDSQKNKAYAALFSTSVYRSEMLNVKIGAKLGFLQKKIKYEYSLFSDKSAESLNCPFIDFGASAQYQNLNIGIAVPNISRTYFTSENSEKEYINKGFIFNTSYTINVCENSQ